MHPPQPPKGATIIDAKGKYVMPGGIDPHTHLDMPFMGEVSCDSFFSGHQAALAGGTTMHIDFAQPVDHDLLAGLRAWQAKAAQGAMDYGFHMIVTSWSDKVGRCEVDRRHHRQQVAKDMETLATHHGISSFKFFLAYKGIFQISDAELIAGLQRCGRDTSVPFSPLPGARNWGRSRWCTQKTATPSSRGSVVCLKPASTDQRGTNSPDPPSSRSSVHARVCLINVLYLHCTCCTQAEATARAIRLAAWVNTPLYVVHVMSRDAMEEVAAARQRGWRVVGEALASGLGVDDRKLCVW